MKFSQAARIAGLTAAAAVLVGLVSGAAYAGSTNTSVTVSASVPQDCKMTTTTNIAFGTYDPVTVSAVTDATGALTVSCTKAASGVTLTLSAGSGTPTAPQTRAMTGTAHGNFLSYDVFEDSGYSTRFPTTAVSETISGGITTPTVISLYGQIPAAAQDVSVDSYNDTLTATLNF